MDKMDSYYYLAVLYLIIIPSLCDDWTSHCPWNCTCKWTNGKKSALCNTLELKQVPRDLSTELQVLALNENKISDLHREEFTSLGLNNLQRIFLKKSQIESVDKDAFRDLKILIEIDLSENEIVKIERNTFYGNERLRILYLNGNPIKTIVAEQFPKLPHLRSLDLHSCQIQTIHRTAFQNLELLELLNIKTNLLEYLDGSVFSHMSKLKTLVIDENPWNCDCRLREFRVWYLKSSVNSQTLTCKNPFVFKNQNWQSIEEQQFGCRPTIEFHRNPNQTEDIGSNITYSCFVSGDPLPVITWTLNGKILDNENILFGKNITESGRWLNITIINVTSQDTGVYTCSAKNVVGFETTNVSLILEEQAEHVIVEPPKTFLFFRLIVASFCGVFGIIFMSIAVCLCQKALRRRKSRKNIKGSVSFNDQEKKLLDLSITTNERQDSCEMVNTPSTNKTESIIALEPVQITIENISRNEEFPLNVGVFPPPPEFCSSNVIPNPAYGNIFISVSVTQDGLDNPDLNMYPDLLNIPNRVKGKFLPVNVSSFATLPRNNRPSTSKKDTTKFINENLVNYQNLETNYMSKGVGVGGGGGGSNLNGGIGMVDCNNFKMCSACVKNQGKYCNEDFIKCERNVMCPKYDNMGRRVTAGGNTSLAISHRGQPNNNESMTVNGSEIIYENSFSDVNEIPTPPLPPSGSDFVSL